MSSPLDVSGFALAAVREAADAAARLAAARGLDAAVTASPQAVVPAFAAIEHLRIDGRAVEAWAPLSGFFAAEDSWVRLHGNYPHHADAIRRALRLPQDAQKEDVARSLQGIPALAVEERIIAAGGVAAAVRTPEEWDAHPQAQAMAAAPWADVALGAEARTTPADGGPLAGVRVLDLTRVIAGPTASQLLACLGADVLRLDPPHRPEHLEAHLSTGMGKRSGILDLRSDAAVLHERLLPDADVVLLGYRPGALDRYGLAPEDLAAAHPGLVIGALSAWGDIGPWGRRAGFDSIVQAATGIAAICGTAERPGALPVQALDHATGFRLAAAVMDLLAAGRGGVVRTSLLGAARTLRAAGPGIEQGLDWGAVPDGGLPALDSPHGALRAVAPPILVDGAQVAGPIGRYGAAEMRWPDRPEEGRLVP